MGISLDSIEPRQLSVGQVLGEAGRCLNLGENRQALDLLEASVRVAPHLLELRHGLGEVQALSGQVDAAIQNLRIAVNAAPTNVCFQLSLAEALRGTRPAEAVPHFYAAIERGSQEPYAYWHLVALLVGQQRFEEAVRVCESGLKLNPGDVSLVRVKALTLLSLGSFEKALEGVLTACSQDPKNLEIWNLLGDILRDGGQLAEAEQCGRQACALDAKSAEAHVNLATTLLISGKYPEGFKEYEWRRQMSRAASLKHPQWDGLELNGKRILLWAEQGLGDAIQFARYVDLVRQRGGKVILGVSTLLTRLMAWMPGELSVVSSLVTSQGNPLFDVQCPLMTLPFIFGTELNSIPRPASFVIPEARRGEWQQRLGCQEKLKIGLVWAGNPDHKNDSNRSIEFKQVKRLLAVPSCHFFSLQVGRDVQIESEGIENLAPLLTDFAETAAAISQLDLVITVDTSVAHLAGSLGVPTWVLLPIAPDWRWMLGREDSPWYPSMRLFRQSTRRDWESVIELVAKELDSGYFPITKT